MLSRSESLLHFPFSNLVVRALFSRLRRRRRPPPLPAPPRRPHPSLRLRPRARALLSYPRGAAASRWVARPRVARPSRPRLRCERRRSLRCCRRRRRVCAMVATKHDEADSTTSPGPAVGVAAPPRWTVLNPAVRGATPADPRYGKIRGHQRAPSGSREFKELTKRDAQVQLQHELDRLLGSAPEAHRALAQGQLDGFARLFDRFLRDEGPSVQWENIERLPENAVCDYNSLVQPSTDLARCMLEKLVVVKLNGGLGTSMGCHGPKSVIPVRSDLTFLDLTVQQIEHLNKTYKANVPLVLMNSFNTDEDTQKIIRKYKGLQVEIYTFNQSCYPRINRDSLLPVPKTCNVNENMDAWYPPGHGDFYYSFLESGLLRRFLEEGREYCFISNIDNLGATVDLNILNFLMDPSSGEPAPEFVMEVTDKTRSDVKGGTLIQYEGKLRLLEIAQVPKEHVDDFKSVKTFKFFNTNNLWMKLDAIKRVLDNNTLNMEVIVNNKSLENGLNIIQLETAVGAAMKCFDGGLGINVPRSRFLPVKKTQDLLLVMSNLYSLQHGSLVMSPERMFPTTPFIKLGDNHFAKVKEFLSRFANIPDLMELDHLTVSGDVTFGKNVSLKGTVIIIANHGDRIDIPSGSVLENKIVSGNMRILDH